MELKNEITKEIFEKYVPVAKTAERNVSVFSRMEGFFHTQYQYLCQEVIGSGFVQDVERNEMLKVEMVRYICISAFVSAARSLDLVLTGTGFGIVSTESMVPASAKRVDELIADLSLQSILAVERIVEGLISIEGWGATDCARAMIPTLFYRPEMMRQRCTMPLTASNWQIAKSRAMVADTLLRDEISTEYMDALLDRLRTASMTNGDIIMQGKCAAAIGEYISNSDRTGGKLNESLVRQCVTQLETYPVSYPEYRTSALYSKRHAEGIKNEKDSPSFFFM